MWPTGGPVMIKSEAKKYRHRNMRSRVLITCNNNNEEDRSLPSTEGDDLVLGIEGLQLSVVTKAAAISHLVKGVTIGPNKSMYTEGLAADGNSTLELESQTSNTLSVASNSVDFNRQHTVPSNKVAPEYENSKSEEKSRAVMKMMVELDKQRREEVRQTINARSVNYERQARKHQEELKSRQAALKLEAEARAQLEKQQILCQRREVELRELHQQEQLKYEHEQRVKERNHMIQKAEQRQEEERKRREDKNKQIATISQCQSAFVKRYQEILESLKICKGKKELSESCSSHIEMVKNLTHSMEQLVKQCKLGDITPADLQKASAMLSQIGSYSQIVQEEVRRINENIEKTSLNETTTKNESPEGISQPAGTLHEPQSSITPEIRPSSLKTDFSENLNESPDRDAMNTYLSLIQFLQNFEKSYSDLLKDDQNKEFIFKCRKAVNIPINSISDKSAAHLNDKIQKLTSLLSGQTVESGNVRVSANAHPQGVAFCMDLLAQKFVFQGKTVVSSRKETAFPIAAVIVHLWSQFPMFGTLLLAHLYKSCPYLVPVSLPQVENQTNEEFYILLGYSLDDDGKVEKQAKYLKRMSGLMCLYSAVLTTKVRGHNIAHPHGQRFAWRWLSRTLNMGPQPDLTATLLLDFLEITGSTMSATYGRQFQKLLHFICTEYFPMMDKIGSSGGPVARLEVFLEKTLKEGRIHPPSGMLPANFW